MLLPGHGRDGLLRRRGARASVSFGPSCVLADGSKPGVPYCNVWCGASFVVLCDFSRSTVCTRRSSPRGLPPSESRAWDGHGDRCLVATLFAPSCAFATVAGNAVALHCRVCVAASLLVLRPKSEYWVCILGRNGSRADAALVPECCCWEWSCGNQMRWGKRDALATLLPFGATWGKSAPCAWQSGARTVFTLPSRSDGVQAGLGDNSLKSDVLQTLALALLIAPDNSIIGVRVRSARGVVDLLPSGAWDGLEISGSEVTARRCTVLFLLKSRARLNSGLFGCCDDARIVAGVEAWRCGQRGVTYT